MWCDLCRSLPQFPRLSLLEERRLIARAKQGSKREIDEIVLRHVDFVAFRIGRKAFRHYRERFGSDMLSEAVFILYETVKTYNLRYRDKQGDLKPVRFSSYIGKRVDGFILDFVREASTRESKRVTLDPERCPGTEI